MCCKLKSNTGARKSWPRRGADILGSFRARMKIPNLVYNSFSKSVFFVHSLGIEEGFLKVSAKLNLGIYKKSWREIFFWASNFSARQFSARIWNQEPSRWRVWLSFALLCRVAARRAPEKEIKERKPAGKQFLKLLMRKCRVKVP